MGRRFKVKEIPETLTRYWKETRKDPAQYDYMFSIETIEEHDPAQAHSLHIYKTENLYHAVALRTWDGWENVSSSEDTGATLADALVWWLNQHTYDIGSIGGILKPLFEMIKCEQPAPLAVGDAVMTTCTVGKPKQVGLFFKNGGSTITITKIDPKLHEGRDGYSHAGYSTVTKITDTEIVLSHQPSKITLYTRAEEVI